MNYKVGDTVRVKSKVWFALQEKDKDGYVKPPVNGFRFFTIAMAYYLGKETTIKEAINGYYNLGVDDCVHCWEDWMLETSAPKHIIKRRKFSPINRVIY